MNDTVRLYKTFNGKLYQVDVELTDFEIATIQFLRTNDWMKALKHKDDSIIEIFRDDKDCNLLGQAKRYTNIIRLNHCLFNDLKSARNIYLHELSHIVLNKYNIEGHNIIFFVICGILLLRGNNMQETSLNSLVYYDMQNAILYDNKIIINDENYSIRLFERIGKKERNHLSDVYLLINKLAKSSMTLNQIVDYLLFEVNTLTKYILKS